MKVVHYEIHADDIRRAEHFYEKVLGQKITRWDKGEYWMLDGGRGDGINGGLMQRTKGMSTLIYFEVDDIESAMQAVRDNGGKVLGEKMVIEGMGYSAMVRDTEGNMLGLFQAHDKCTGQ
jgi:hypothetical protein